MMSGIAEPVSQDKHLAQQEKARAGLKFFNQDGGLEKTGG